MFKITIIISINNVKDNLSESFDSILNQTIGFENLQVIFVNKFPIDLVKKYSIEFPNVISIEADSNIFFKGQLNNIGIKHAVSDYILFLTMPNKLEENACELLYNNMLKEDADFVCGVKNIESISTNEITLDFQIFENNPFFINELNVNNALFKKSFLIKNNYNLFEKYSEFDSTFFFNSLLDAKKIKFFRGSIINNFNLNLKYNKELIKQFVDATFEMYFISISKNKMDFFINNILFARLNYLINHILRDELKIKDILDMLCFSRPLFELFIKKNSAYSKNIFPMFENISQGNFEKVLYLIFGEDIPKQADIKIVYLCDDDTFELLRYECNLIKLNFKNWLNQFETEKPDLFLLTSKIFEEYEDKRIAEILNYCHSKNILSIFWENNYLESSYFINWISHFDYIFTNSKKKLSFYMEKGHKNTYYLMLATQPKIFNPINDVDRLKEEVIFFGNFNSNTSKSWDILLQNLSELKSKNFGIGFLDNSYGSTNSINFNPAFYLTVDDSEIHEIYKRSEFGFIFNEENGVCDQKIFELMSSNTFIFSNYSGVLFDEFKNNIYYLGDDSDFNNENFEKIKNENLHNVLKNHSYSNRLNQILDTVNFKYIPNIKHITIFYQLDNLNELENFYNHFYSINYPFKRMVIITTEDKLYLPNTILKGHYENIQLNENDYFCFADLNLSSDFVEDALLHFNYIGKDIGIKEDIEKKFLFDKTCNIQNVIFNSSKFENIVSENESKFDIYCFNNFVTKVSVIIPVYNVEKYLRECLDSIINQTMKDLEIICVDDGSSDNSLEILEEYAKKDSRIKIISQSNQGLSCARNIALDNARGKYIYFIDSDDFLELNGLKEMYQQAEFKDLDLLKFNLWTYEDDTGIKKSLYQRVKPAFLKELGDIIFDYKTIGADVYTLSPNMQSSFFRKETIKDCKFPKGLIFEDNIFLIEALFNSNKVYYYDKFLANKRERKGSITESTGENFQDIIEIRNQIVDLAKKYNHYEDYKFTIFSRKYMFIKLLFLQTGENNKKSFFEKIQEDCKNKKEEYEKEGIFEILDEKSIKIFEAGLNSKNYKEFEELIRKAI